MLNVWEIRAPNGAVSHVMGTYHFGISLDEALPGEHVRMLDESRLLVGEIDLAHLDASVAGAAMILPPGEDLATQFAPELWQPLASAIPSVPEPALHRLRPIAAMILVMGAQAAEQQRERRAARAGGSGPSDPGASSTAPDLLDMALFRRAAERGMPTAGLETIDVQLALLGQVPTSAVEEYLRSTLLPHQGPAAPSESLAAGTMQAFVDGDLATIFAEIQREAARAPRLFEAFLFERNAAWMAPLAAELERGGAFVAVGLGHLLGDRGLLAMLAQRGYSVTRVRR